jgi:DNA recombination protein RmuC
VAYERYHRSEDTETREEALKAHLQSVRRHVQELSAKDYAALEGIRSLDFVLMFIPVEGAFELVLEKAPELFEQAFERNIVLVSGTTLLVTLRTIRHAWRDLQQSRNAQAIAREAGLLYDKFVGFTEALELVGRQLDKARQAHRQARDRLVSGRGNLLGRTQRLLDLGVKAKKQLPAEIEKMAADNPAADEGRRNGYRRDPLHRLRPLRQRLPQGDPPPGERQGRGQRQRIDALRSLRRRLPRGGHHGGRHRPPPGDI